MLNGSTHLGQMLLNKVAHRARVTELDFWVELKCNASGVKANILRSFNSKLPSRHYLTRQGRVALGESNASRDVLKGLQDSYLTSTDTPYGRAAPFMFNGWAVVQVLGYTVALWLKTRSTSQSRPLALHRRTIEIFAEVLEFLRAPCPQRRVARTLIEILIRYLAVPQTQLQSTIIYHNLPRRFKASSFTEWPSTQPNFNFNINILWTRCPARRIKILLGHSENFNPLRGSSYEFILSSYARFLELFFAAAVEYLKLNSTCSGLIQNFLALRGAFNTARAVQIQEQFPIFSLRGRSVTSTQHPPEHRHTVDQLESSLPAHKGLTYLSQNPDYWGFSAATSKIFFRCAAPIILQFVSPLRGRWSTSTHQHTIDPLGALMDPSNFSSLRGRRAHQGSNQQLTSKA
ncbi:hypothetical protein C8R46DRAFT_1042544 [Mycena filopes]|nr:hypothetical protein C8R46DRAFT_1042544 [Mycena filopes]